MFDSGIDKVIKDMAFASGDYAIAYALKVAEQLKRLGIDDGDKEGAER
jgi:hypothetical protein